MRQIKRRQRNSSARVCRRRIQFLRAQKLVAKVLFVVAAMSCLNTGVSQAHTPHDHVEHIVISPEFIQDQTLFIVVRQNLFRSVDGGGKWQRLVRGIDNKHEFSSLAISRQRKDLLLLATRGDGIYSSRDGGNSWAKANAGLTSHDIRLISMSPSSSSFALAVDDENRLYRTNNGGEIWELIFRSPDQLSAIEFISGEQEHIIAGDVRGTLYQSRDQGETWNKLATLEGAGGKSVV